MHQFFLALLIFILVLIWVKNYPKNKLNFFLNYIDVTINSTIILSNVHFIVHIIYFKNILMKCPATQTHILTHFQFHSTIAAMRWKKKRTDLFLLVVRAFSFVWGHSVLCGCVEIEEENAKVLFLNGLTSILLVESRSSVIVH